MAALLEVRGLSNFFGNVCTARDLDLDFAEGVLTSIIGPNGAGKSTLVNLITGHLPVQKGRIAFLGREVTRLPVHRRVRLGMGRSFQIANVFPQLTVVQNVLIPALAQRGRTARLLSRVSREQAAHLECEQLLERLGLSAEQNVLASALSHGDRRLLEVGVAMASRPRLLFLDEPTAGMNPVERTRLLGSIRALSQERRATFVLVEHDMDVVFALSHRVVVLHRGELLCDGPPERVRGDARVREVYLGDEVSEAAGAAGGAAP
ncbi:MAG TPA: ABC transporter ATP-binding protein [Anaeromyxobacteraceae bacterium]|nr:ABC transporter ATP-binding protein [Anaeromyxobacteraceae bacterium]